MGDAAGSASRLASWLLALAVATPLAAQDEPSDQRCLDCHGRDGVLAEDEASAGMLVDADLFARSVHGSAVACTDCHLGHEEFPHPSDAPTAACSTCHAKQAAALADSVHAAPGPGSSRRAPACQDCHGTHDVLPAADRASRLHPLNVHRACGACHFDIDPRTATVDELMAAPYAGDVHAEGILRAGLTVSATCVSCHGGHSIRAHGDPESPVSVAHVDKTCGACHLGVLEQFATSVHHEAAALGERAATCTDCHLPHTMAHPSEAFRAGVVETCGGCHVERATTFFETFHGKASRLGSSTAARCQDCHGMHAVLRPDDPASPLAPGNIVGTCRQCHPGAHESFARYDPHATPHDPDRHPALYWTARLMTALLVGTLAAALLHSLLWLRRLLATRAAWAPHKAAARRPSNERVFLRFSASQRGQHLVLMLAFFDLALTGMALKFSYAPWAQVVANALGGAEAMRFLHRAGASALLAVFLVHVFSFLRRGPGRRTLRQRLTGPDSINFQRSDLQQLRQMLRWFLGRSPRPAFDRYTYWEKFDYMAVFWGVAVIGLSGLMLWFPEAATRLVSGRMLNVAALVHGDEALLAAVFIFTVHFFNSHFRPDKFPLDPVMFTGRMTLDEMRWEKPRELERLAAAGELEARLVEPYPPVLERRLRLFGYVALGVGVALDLLIAAALIRAVV